MTMTMTLRQLAVGNKRWIAPSNGFDELRYLCTTYCPPIFAIPKIHAMHTYLQYTHMYTSLISLFCKKIYLFVFLSKEHHYYYCCCYCYFIFTPLRLPARPVPCMRKTPTSLHVTSTSPLSTSIFIPKPKSKASQLQQYFLAPSIHHTPCPSQPNLT